MLTPSNVILVQGHLLQQFDSSCFCVWHSVQRWLHFQTGFGLVDPWSPQEHTQVSTFMELLIPGVKTQDHIAWSTSGTAGDLHFGLLALIWQGLPWFGFFWWFCASNLPQAFYRWTTYQDQHYHWLWNVKFSEKDISKNKLFPQDTTLRTKIAGESDYTS